MFTGGGSDYYGIGPHTINFPAGETNVSFSITIRNDGYFEYYELFYLRININSLPNNVTYGAITEALVIIENADSKYILYELNK